MMKRKLNEPKGSSPKGTPSGETKKVRKASGYFGDPRLIPRVRQYLKAHSQKTISPSEIAEDLQRQFGEYGRKKKNAFYKMVEKAYQIIRESDREPADSMSRLEEKHLQKKAATALSCSESDDVESIDSDASFSDENAAYVQYNDSNAMNNMMSQLYKSTPTTSRTSSPKPNTSTTVEDYSPAQKSNDACITIDDSSDSDNPDSARRDKGLGNYQAFCIDRSGQNSMYMKPHNPPIMLPMMDEIRFLPQNMVINAGINAGLLPQHSHTSRDIPQVISPTEAVRKRNVDNVSIISDVTENSIADKSVNKSAKKTPHKISKKKKEKQVNKEEKQKGPELQTSNVTFADIGGNEHTLMDICKLLVHMKHPEVYMQLGVTPPRGFLLHGPPGCGKTLLAIAIAGELSLPLIKIAATEVVSGVSGESEEKVRDLFDKAVAAAPSILFIDEIDAITPKRETASKDMERRIVAQLLSCMDDLNSRGDAPVLVIGATNRPDSLDPALRRAGRFDREISLGIPDEAARGRILQVLCRTLTLDDDFDCKFLSRNTPGFVGADLMALTREAAMIAVNRVFNQLQNASKCLPDKTQQSCDNIKVSPCETAKSNQASGEVIMNGAEKKSEETQDDKKDSGNSVHDKDEKENGIEETENMKGNDGKDNKGSDSSHCDGENKQTSEQVQTIPSQDTDCVMDVTEEIPSTSTAPTVSQTGQEDLKLVLQWLKDHPPLTENQLKDITITMQDFKDALKFVQPSAKREGFATIPGVTWNDIGALHHIREELQLAIMAPVRHAQEFKDLGLTQAQGILLAGPPGCGKTLLAKAIANESGINFISVKGPELLNMYVGESERAVRQVFQRGRNSAPCVIFFDEIDSLCPKRSLSGESGSSVRVVNQLLTEMDGLEDRKQVFIMAATNRPDIIDPAILRPGRLDKLLYVGLPSEADRHDILKTISKNGTKPRLSSDVDLQAIANDKRCQGFTGADLAALVREASLCALKSIIKSKSDSAHSPEVNTQHFEEAFVKVKPSVSTQDQKKYEDMRNGIVK